MLLTITNRTAPTSDLSWLLVKHPGKLQKFDISYGNAHVFYPEANDGSHQVALLLDLDAVGMARSDQANATIDHYINDRPYTASSMLSAAIRRVFGSALGGVCKDRQELVAKRLDLSATLSAVQCWKGESVIRRLFEPLGYTVECQPHQYDANFPEWGESPYFTVTIHGDKTVQELLSHLYVLIPVLDNGKHYQMDEGEVAKLLKHGEAWLPSHPEQRMIVQRYLGYKKGLANRALGVLADAASADGADEKRGGNLEGKIEALVGPGEKPVSLHQQRHDAVMAALAACGATTVIDMGCNTGKLLEAMVKDDRLVTIRGFDASPRSLSTACRFLKIKRRKGRGRRNEDVASVAQSAVRVDVFQSSLYTTDERMRGYDAVTCVEVVEHLEPSRLPDFEMVLFAWAAPQTIVLTTPNREYNVRFEFLKEGGLRHDDHRFEWTRQEFAEWCQRMGARYGYHPEIQPVGPVDDEVGAPSQMVVFHKVQTLVGFAPDFQHSIDLAQTLENRGVNTRLVPWVKLDYGNRKAAFETAARHTVDPRWMLYLPPTMSPCETHPEGDFLEHPAQALDYFRTRGVKRVVCEEKHMGSRAVVVVCRDEGVARKRFGVERGGLGACYTRMGRSFFSTHQEEHALLTEVRDSLTAANMWERLGTGWVLLDCELMPWSAKAQGLIKKQYAAVSASALASFPLAGAALSTAAQRGLPVEALLEQYRLRGECAVKFRDAYRPYCWPVNSMADLKLAPFHLLASEGHVHSDKDHLWHMSMLHQVAQCSSGLIVATGHMEVDVESDADRQKVTEWWLRHTKAGGEGMVIKPFQFLTEGTGADGQKRLVQPAVKCRGQEYLRIIYGADYTMPHNLERLRSRGTNRKRWLAIHELAVGLEGLERFVAGEPLGRVHECAFGVLALECEPMDPRL